MPSLALLRYGALHRIFVFVLLELKSFKATLGTAWNRHWKLFLTTWLAIWFVCRKVLPRIRDSEERPRAKKLRGDYIRNQNSPKGKGTLPEEVEKFRSLLHARIERIFEHRWNRIRPFFRKDWKERLNAIVKELVKSKNSAERSPDPATEAVVTLLIDEIEAIGSRVQKKVKFQIAHEEFLFPKAEQLDFREGNYPQSIEHQNSLDIDSADSQSSELKIHVNVVD